jgi:hypothetical protein
LLCPDIDPELGEIAQSAEEQGLHTPRLLEYDPARLLVRHWRLPPAVREAAVEVLVRAAWVVRTRLCRLMVVASVTGCTGCPRTPMDDGLREGALPERHFDGAPSSRGRYTHVPPRLSLLVPSGQVVFDQMASVKIAPPRNEPNRLALVRSAPVKLVPSKEAPTKSAPLR